MTGGRPGVSIGPQRRVAEKNESNRSGKGLIITYPFYVILSRNPHSKDTLVFAGFALGMSLAFAWIPNTIAAAGNCKASSDRAALDLMTVGFDFFQGGMNNGVHSG